MFRPHHTWIPVARFVGGVSLLLSVVVGFTHYIQPLPLGPSVDVSLPVALPIVLTGATGLIVLACVWDRSATDRQRADLLAALQESNTKLTSQAAELAVQRNEGRLLESAVAHAHDAVVVLDSAPQTGAGRRVRYANAAFYRMTGYTADEVVGRSLHLLRGPASDPTTLSRVRRALDDHRPVQTELQNYRKDGSAYWVELSLVPVPDPNGRISHWVMIQRDITDRKRAEDALRRSEERYRLLFDRNPHPMWVFDQETGRFLAVNDAAVDTYGYTRDEFLGMTVTDLLAHGEAGRLQEAIQPSEGTSSVPSLRRYRTKEGAQVDVEVSSFSLPLDGRPAELVLAIDVTERLRAEARVRQSEGLFRGIFEVTSAGVSLTDATGRFTACNPAFAEMVGRPIEDLLGLTPAEITHPDDWASQLPLMEDARAGRQDRFDVRKRYLRPDGRVVWAELSFCVIRGPDGRYEAGLGVTVDVTDRQQLEDKLRHALKLEAIGQMAGGVAHDFNNLLTAVLGNLALVRAQGDIPGAGHLLVAEEAAARAADLTRKLLGYARRSQLSASPVDLRMAFDRVVEEVRRRADPRIQIEVVVSAECGRALADPRLLDQALLNLSENACEAMPEGGILTLAVGPAGAVNGGPEGYLRLSVTDTGVGMANEVKARMFDPFFTTKEVGKGAGLGLAMVLGIVEQHKGWVECTSFPAVGTRIDLFLPEAIVIPGTISASAPTPPPLPRPEPRPARQGERLREAYPPSEGLSHALLGEVLTPKPPCSTPAANAMILLVDDESMIRELGRVILERAGFVVITAEDGVEAVEVFAREQHQIQLVILDVTMPRMSGRDAYQHIARLNPDARVLFCTGFSAEDITAIGGPVGLLGKPYRPNDLLAAVRDALAITPAGRV